MTPAVLFLIFNRPDTTARVFEAVRAARPSRLYVAADGARAGRTGEFERCAEARRIATAVDWPCELRVLLRDANLGCRAAVSGAITWFFAQEEEGIILEDDTLPDPSFFPYCSALLERYRFDTRILAICGGGYSDSGAFGGASYAFARVFDPWGWASWRRAWECYDDTFEGLEDCLRSGRLKATGPSRFACEGYWYFAFSETKNGNLDSWGYRWTYSIFKEGGLVIYPATNLIANLGFREDATHTRSSDGDVKSPLSDMELDSLTFPISHPKRIVYNELFEFDFYLRRLEFKIPSLLEKFTSAARRALSLIVPQTIKGRRDYYRAIKSGATLSKAFGGEDEPLTLITAIMRIQEPSLIVEAQTCLGGTTEALASFGRPVVTIEQQGRRYGFSSARLRKFPNVQIRRGPRDQTLRDLFHQRPSSRLLVISGGHAKEGPRLLEELKIIFEGGTQAVVLFDSQSVIPCERNGSTSVAKHEIDAAQEVDVACRTLGLIALFSTRESNTASSAARHWMVLTSEARWAEGLLSTGLLRRG